MRLQVVKRDNFPFWKRCLLYVGAIVAALAVGAVVLLAIGVNPIKYYWQMFTMDTVGNANAYTTFINYIKKFLPLVLTSVALSLAFKMRFWNIGGEGQFIIGAISAAFVAFKLGPVMPDWLDWLTLIIMCLAAMAAAGIYGVGVGALKVKFGTNETLLTLMLNYIAIYILDYLSKTGVGTWNPFLQKDNPRPTFESFTDIVSFPSIPMGDFKLNICFIFTLLIGVVVYIYLKRSKQGYEISVVGDSANTAHYAGMKVNRIILRTVFMSAALIGLAAAFKVGSEGTLSTAITDDVGWTGIIVAWLAQLNTVSIFIVSALICVLQQGSIIAASEFAQVNSSFSNMLQGIILFMILASDFFIRFRVVLKKKGGK